MSIFAMRMDSLSLHARFTKMQSMRFSLFLCLAVAYIARANEIIVRDAESLRSALRDLKPGMTLKVSPGEYPGDHMVSGVAKLTIEALDPKQPPLFKGGKIPVEEKNGVYGQVSSGVK
jgi:hypothetical protein